MTKPYADVITGALRVQGTPHPAVETKAVLQALDGHGYEIRLKPKTNERRHDCRQHPDIETPNGICPICGPTGDWPCAPTATS